MSERKKDKNWALNSTSEDNFKNQNSNIKIRKSKLKNKNALINKIKQQGGGGWVGEGTTYNGSYKWMICLGKYIKTNINTLIYILSAS